MFDKNSINSIQFISALSKIFDKVCAASFRLADAVPQQQSSQQAVAAAAISSCDSATATASRASCHIALALPTCLLLGCASQ